MGQGVEAASPDERGPADGLGGRLRAERLRSGLTLRAAARQLGVSPAFVSQIENGKSQPSVATLYSLAQLLGTSIDALFQQAPPGEGGSPGRLAGRDAKRPAAAPGQAEQAGTADDPVSRSVLGSPAAAFGRSRGRSRLSIIRPAERPRIVMDSGVVWEQLARNTGDDLDFLEIIYPPHASSTTDNRMLQHAGFEFGCLIEGELEITVGFDTFMLRAGDSLGFDSALPHLFRNNGSRPARGIWVVRHARG